MKIKFKFNMVEIALAIVIIAIGLSSLLVLFPIGINATRAAMDENGFPDAAEYISSYVRGQFLDTWRNEFGQASVKIQAGTPLPAQVFSTGFSGFLDNQYKADPTNGFSWGSPMTNYPELSKNSGSDGVYKFTRTGPSGEEIFSCIIKVWSPGGSHIQNANATNLSQCPLYVPDASPNKSFAPALTGNITFPCGSAGEMIQSVLVEISWPITAPEAERNKRVFRIDVANPYYFPRST